MKELGIAVSPQALRTFVQDPELDACILSFEQPEGQITRQA